nr:glycosyltransferase [uncultured Bacteroides sp.]
MPTLLQINTSLNCNSTGKIAEQIGLLAKSQGWDCYVAHGPRFKKESALKSYEIESNLGEKLHLMKSLLVDGHGLSSKKATARFVEWINSIKPDIIHFHNIHGYYLNYPILIEYLQKANIPVIWTFHDCWPITGHCGYFSLEGCEKWRTGCGKCPLRWKEYPKSLIVDRSAKNYQLKKQLFCALENLNIISVSKWLDSIVGESFLSNKHHSYIYNGIDVNIFKPTTSELRKRYGIGEKKILLGVASIWTTRKALADYIELSHLLPKDYKVVLVGPTEKQAKAIPDGIIVISRTNNQQELAQWYSEADILLNLSYEETFGLTTVEGFACGTPSIVYNKTASPELITNHTGAVVEAGDYDALIKAIINITSKGKASYSAACRQRAVEHFNKDDRFQDYINLYNELLNEKSCPR